MTFHSFKDSPYCDKCGIHVDAAANSEQRCPGFPPSSMLNIPNKPEYKVPPTEDMTASMMLFGPDSENYTGQIILNHLGPDGKMHTALHFFSDGRVYCEGKLVSSSDEVYKKFISWFDTFEGNRTKYHLRLKEIPNELFALADKLTDSPSGRISILEASKAIRELAETLLKLSNLIPFP